MDAGFFPNSVSTDMHASEKSKMKNILDIMSEFLAMGMSIPELISAVTWNPAREIRHEELGNMSVGSVADITLLKVYKGNFVFNDHAGYKKEGTKKINCVMTIKGGKIVYRGKG
jgi:dihydroorotase